MRTVLQHRLILEATERKRHVIASSCAGNLAVLEKYPDAEFFGVEALSNLLNGEEICGKR